MKNTKFKTTLIATVTAFMTVGLVSCGEKAVESITLSKTEVSVAAGQKTTITATVLPADATKKDVTWSSSDTTIATVNAGEITGVKEGSCTVTVTSVENAKIKQDCTVTVTKPSGKKVTSVELDQHIGAIVEGKTVQLTATVLPADADNKNVEWSSSDDKIATVSNTGLVTGVGFGNATITVKSKENPSIKDDFELSVFADMELTGISRNKLFTDFEGNRDIQAASEEAFIDQTKVYTIGSDNVLNFRPSLEIYDSNGHKVDDSLWPYDYTVKVEEGTVDKTSDYVEVKDARKGLIQFKKAAEGKTVKVTFTPGGQEGTSFRQSETVKIVNGYNITKADELTLFDNRGTGYDWDFYGLCDFTGGTGFFDPKMVEFKQSKGLSGITPDNFVLHGNLTITKDNIPSIFCYSAEELKGYGDDDAEVKKVAGSLKDRMYLYSRTVDKGVMTNFYGNYFKLDFSTMPRVIRMDGDKSKESQTLTSHASIFRPRQGSFNFEDVNIVGNGERATSEEQAVNAGGLICIKISESIDNINISNIIAKKNYICLMSEVLTAIKTSGLTVTNVDKCKFYDNYNSFFYNFGITMNIKDSIVARAGGPVIISDHVYTKDSTIDPTVVDGDPVVLNTEATEPPYYNVAGNVAVVNLENCQIESRVLGTEAWFQEFGATAVAGMIKSLSDLVFQKGLKPTADPTVYTSYSYVTDKDGNPVIAQKATGDTAFNFLSLGKNAELTGLADLPSKGVAATNIKTATTDEKYDYDLDKAVDLTAYGQGKVPFFEFYRGIRNAGAPIFQSNGGWVVAVPSNPAKLEESTWAMYDLVKYALYNKFKDTPYSSYFPLPAEVDCTHGFYTGMTSNIILHYQGLAILMGVKPLETKIA